MKCKKIISGGQTGADQAGLVCGRKLGLETGGFAPRGWHTEEGPEPELASYGLVESHSSGYATRTWQNVNAADATVWFGTTTSPGFKCTQNGAKAYSKPFIINPTHEEMVKILEDYESINVAGNRYAKNPRVVSQVFEAFGVTFDV